MENQQHKLLKILIIGDSCLDRYHYGICDRMSPEAPVPILKILRTETRPGMVLNVQQHLENFFFDTVLYTNKEKIVKERFVENTFMQHMLRVDHGEEKKVSSISFETIDKINFELFSGVVISDYDKGYISSESAKKISKKAKEENIPVFVDSKKTDLSCFPGSIIKINEKENKKIKTLPKNCELIVTLGKKGAIWNGISFPTKDVEVFDICGAGDSFFAGFINSYLINGDIEKSIEFANNVAAVSVKNFGTYIVKKEDL
jgi:D-beta-D-heptose 7-phosphate kinase/D-beta-D-heptose 1-phosphate adenosyltransferase